MIQRGISEALLKATKSVLLLGPRQVGKSTLISNLQPEFTVQLADEVEFLRYASLPQAFRDDVTQSGAQTVLVDEIQRLPNLLNTIQAMIDRDPRLKFLLTGSSARKLKRGQANLLPGRIFQCSLGPSLLPN